ncbi:hypothetical protein [Actinokineospora fastidiosa]|uniref:Uncharacterized protein n=1 Tax=Actinokineospora fastidiosa TaxID=1816 RepID=A0A918GSS4_9PSEU|nr:hypothetical protein [Actinokineospora fastidiosa]GGS57145.1 hypothetical protein GCM10010171_60110 [Actinokineospora fastidiosa]
MDLDHLNSAATDPAAAIGGDPFATAAQSVPGARTRALAGLSAPAQGGIQFSWVFTTISAPSA